MEFNNKLKPEPAPITPESEQELDNLAKEYAKLYNEYTTTKGGSNIKNVLTKIDQVVSRVTDLVGYDKRYDVITKYLKGR